jgi:glutathione S-transferase
MTSIKLYFAPGTCARSVLVALEECGADYDLEVVVHMAGEHKLPSYLALNPNGKVPVIVVDEKPITETSAILYYLAKAYPNSNMLPLGRGNIEDAITLSHLMWCGSELHGNVFRIRIPQYFCDEPSGRLRQKQMAMDTMHAKFAIIETRLANGPWFLGPDWSVIDAFLLWVWFRLDGTGFELARYPNFADHYQRQLARPSVMRALAKERVIAEALQFKGLKVNFETFQVGTTPEDFIRQANAR